MKVVIMNREGASRETSFKNRPSTAIISITDVMAPDNVFTPQPWLKAVLRLKFDDVTQNSARGIAIADGQAVQIKEFVEQVKDRVERIIVHCKAGVSRSAGVGAAILYALNGDDMRVFRDKYSLPNMTCYRKVLNAFGVKTDEAVLKEKALINRKLWRMW